MRVSVVFNRQDALHARAGEALRSPSGDDLAPPTLAALLDRIRAGCPRDGRF